jgi:hypothetical protein
MIGTLVSSNGFGPTVLDLADHGTKTCIWLSRPCCVQTIPFARGIPNRIEVPAEVAQSVEQWSEEPCVAGSIPALGTESLHIGVSAAVTRASPVDELIAKTTDWRGAMLAKLRKIVHDADPAIAEDVKWKRPSNPLGSAVWMHDGMVCIGIVLKERVRLSFSAGSSLPDPKKLFNAQLLGKSRAIDFSQNEKVDAIAVRALVKAAVAHNLAKTRPAKTGGKREVGS